jgi:hypothetical protein
MVGSLQRLVVLCNRQNKENDAMRNRFFGTGEPGYHPLRKIKVIKDISASAVGIGILLWSIIMAVELVRLRRLFSSA